jgi:hypothetical protein
MIQTGRAQTIVERRRAAARARIARRIIPDRTRVPSAPHPDATAIASGEPLREGAWKGKRAFVVGGGPSLRGFDFSRLRGERIIAVNRAFEFLPFAEILLSMDFRFFSDVRLTKEFQAFRGRKIWIDTKGFPYKGVETLKSGPADGMTARFSEGIATGGNSGHAALNLALILGADLIYLLGFDFKHGEDGRTHFHPGYGYVDRPGKLDEYLARLEAAAPAIRASGRSVINLSQDSALKGFETERFESIVPKDDFLVTTYYTDENYRLLAERLRASLDHFGIPHDLRAVASRGSWTENTGFRAEFLKGMMDDHPGKNLVWIDADGIVQRYPILLHELEGIDLAVHFKKRAGHRELLGGTMFLRGNDRVRGMMDDWIKASAALPTYKDQMGIRAVIDRDPTRLRVFDLPGTYCQIYDLMMDVGVPVIEHFQASRQFRRAVR